MVVGNDLNVFWYLQGVASRRCCESTPTTLHCRAQCCRTWIYGLSVVQLLFSFSTLHYAVYLVFTVLHAVCSIYLVFAGCSCCSHCSSWPWPWLWPCYIVDSPQAARSAGSRGPHLALPRSLSRSAQHHSPQCSWNTCNAVLTALLTCEYNEFYSAAAKCVLSYLHYLSNLVSSKAT